MVINQAVCAGQITNPVLHDSVSHESPASGIYRDELGLLVLRSWPREGVFCKILVLMRRGKVSTQPLVLSRFSFALNTATRGLRCQSGYASDLNRIRPSED